MAEKNSQESRENTPRKVWVDVKISSCDDLFEKIRGEITRRIAHRLRYAAEEAREVMINNEVNHAFNVLAHRIANLFFHPPQAPHSNHEGKD
jgi:hypothetical protein